MIGVLFSGSFLCGCFTGDAAHSARTHTHTHGSALKPILTHSDLEPDVLVRSHNRFHIVCELKGSHEMGGVCTFKRKENK